MRQFFKGSILITTIYTLFSSVSWAGFLEMPEITEVPDLERKSLLKDLDIPSVRERDPDPEAGPRLNVIRFKLQGVIDFPEYGISKAEVDALVESIRADLMAEFKFDKSGFSINELAELSNLLVEIEDETIGKHVTDLEVQRLVWLIRDQRTRRGITLGTIETIADKITDFYRERGFILAKAYIPQQQVRDGVVTLTLLLGVLGEVKAAGNTLYNSEFLEQTFEDGLFKPVTNTEIEENIYIINDFPGIIANGFFEPGKQVGDTLLNIEVKDEQPININFRLDNHGSEQTGKYRLYGEALANNILGQADQLKFATLFTFNPENAVFGEIYYSSRIISPRLNLSLGLSNNSFTLANGTSESVNSLNLEGETLRKDLTATYTINRSRVNSDYIDITIDNVISKITDDLNNGGLDDDLVDLSIQYRFDTLDEKNRILHQGHIKFLSGKYREGVDFGQPVNYRLIDLSYNFLTFINLGEVVSNSRFIYRANMQIADQPLSSILKYSLAGATKSRAFPVNLFSADRGIHMSTDWVFDAPEFFDYSFLSSNLKEMLQPFVFMDLAYGEVLPLDAKGKKSTAQLSDLGIGLQFTYQSNLKGNLQLAFPLNDNLKNTALEVPGDNFRLIFDLQYNFM